MFDFNILNTPEQIDMFLCTPDERIICQLNGIDDETASITINLNNQSELTFDYFRYINSHDGELIESNGYHDINVGMKILVDKVGFFRIKYPPMKFDGNKETKTINAVSIDNELEDKDLVEFKINTGTEDSAEYLVVYEDDEQESLLNDYTGIPYDYIVFYNTYPEQLTTILGKYADGRYTDSDSIDEIKKFCDLIPRLRRKVIKDSEGDMSIIEYVEYEYDASGENIISVYLSGFNNRVQQLITFYEKYRDQLSLVTLALKKSDCDTNWTIGNVDESLCNKKFQFEIDGKNIYSFLTDDISSVAKCVFFFNLFTKKIDIVLAKNIGKQSGVIIDRKNLLKSLEVSCNSDTIYTRYNVSGGEDIDISYVNFGDTRIDDLTFFMNARNEDGNRIYVTDEIAEKYKQFVSDREIARKEYISLTKKYNQAVIDISDLKYRVPNDSVQNDWDTFSDEELEGMLKAYNSLLATLQSLYKEDYEKSGGCNPDGSINEDYIKNTMYWHDYYAYKQTITQIEEAFHARANDTRYADIDDEVILEKINAYKTEWTLYGTVELENKLTAYNNQLKVLVDGEAVALKTNSEEAKPWSELTQDEKTEYGNHDGGYQYETYMKLYNEKIQCQEYLSRLKDEIAELEIKRDKYQSDREKITHLVDIRNYDRNELNEIVPLPSPTVFNSFSDQEIRIINMFYIDRNYSNENIIITSLDTIVSEIDAQQELLDDAKEQLSIDAQPQVSFNADIENLLAMPEFKDFDFVVGNYVTLEYYDDYYVDMRIASMSFNPCVPEDSCTVTFTNFIKSKAERTDISSILGLAVGNGSGSSGRSSGGSGSGENFGDSDKVDTTISNTMLAKMLNTEMFGTRVSNIILDTIRVNELTTKYAKFEGLAKGTTIIDGKCIETGYIIDQHYNGTNGDIDNTSGSVLNLETGYFNFGGGHLKWNGTDLNVSGAVNATSLSTGGKTEKNVKSNGIYIDSGGNMYAGKNNESIIYSDGSFNFGNGRLIYDEASFKMTSYKNGSCIELLDGAINIKEVFNNSINIVTLDSDGIDINDMNTGAKLSYYGQDGITIYDGSINNNEVLNLYKDGMHIYRNGVSVGKIGSNAFEDNPDRIGLVFSLDYTAQYIAWESTQRSTDDTYEIRMAYYNDENKFDIKSSLYLSNFINMQDNSIINCPYLASGNSITVQGQSDVSLFAIDGRTIMQGKTEASVHAYGPGANAILRSANGEVHLNIGEHVKFACTDSENHSYRDLNMHLHKLYNVELEDVNYIKTNWIRSDGILYIDAPSNGMVCVRNDSKTVTEFKNSMVIFYKPVAMNYKLNMYDNIDMNNQYINNCKQLLGQNGFLYLAGGGLMASGIQICNSDSNNNYVSISCPLYMNYNYINNYYGTPLSSSDIRLKDSISNTKINALELLSKLKLKQFDWIESGKHEDIGFIAQQLNNVIPDLVNIEPNTNRHSIKMVEFIPYLVKAIQELYDLISDTKQDNVKDNFDFEDTYTLSEKKKYIKELNDYINYNKPMEV